MATKGDNHDKEIACKLHRQFAHPTPKTLIKIINNAGIKDKNLENEVDHVSEKCITCIKYRKRFNRPVVCVPMANEFNEMLGIDLKIWGKQYFLVIIDIATRFCAACVINNKVPSTIIKGIFLSWIATFGPPKKIISDNGGEFSNAEMNTFAEAFSIKLIHTAAESPWSNGTVERLNGVLGKLVLKILDDIKCDTDIALAWAVAARNAYYNNSGYSPNQLVFGFNPSMPNIYNSKPPGLKKVSTSEMIAKMTEAKRVAMEAFVKFDSCEKLKRALSSNVRRTIIDDLNIGDEVYYKRDKSEEWYGPAKVILIEGKVITVKHGGVTVKVNTVSLVKIPHICTPECELRNSGHKRNESVMPENQVSDVQNRWDRNKSIIPKEVATDRIEPLVLDNETDSSCSGNKNMISKGVTGDTHRKGKQGLPIMPPDVIGNENVAEPNWIGSECVAETIDSDPEGRIETNLPSNGKRKRNITDDPGIRKKN